ncbi:enolase C-terminal domain-like protein [Streptomyces sp. NPDC048506]|uniref:enolase C-terminal domain-like protein n=1 Tax=Streptomyces sp. NPDC048506 TaxID=3155028 RepID=UPI003437D213
MHVEVTVHRHQLVRSFQVSHNTTEGVDLVHLRLRTADGALAGEGEVSADAGFGQDGPLIATQARELAQALAEEPGRDDPGWLGPQLADAAGTVSGPARMLVEMAFLDAAARASGIAVWQLLGLPAPGLVQLLHTVPIGEEVPVDGRPLKIKLGGPDDEKVLRGLVGAPGPLILDVNRGWDREDWEALRPLVQALAPAVLEDPARRPDLLPEIRAALPGTAVILDEGIATRADVEEALRTADGANIKLMRFGGLLPALEVLDRLAGQGATRMLGCFLEPPRAVAYAAQLAGRSNWTDLDGHFWLCDDPAVMSYTLGAGIGIPRITY